jgi:hypothetical protein
VPLFWRSYTPGKNLPGRCRVVSPERVPHLVAARHTVNMLNASVPVVVIHEGKDAEMITCHIGWSVKALKREIAERWDVAPEHQELLYEGLALCDSQPVQQLWDAAALYATPREIMTSRIPVVMKDINRAGYLWCPSFNLFMTAAWLRFTRDQEMRRRVFVEDEQVSPNQSAPAEAGLGVVQNVFHIDGSTKLQVATFGPGKIRRSSAPLVTHMRVFLGQLGA